MKLPADEDGRRVGGRNAGSLLTNVIAACGRITVPGWTVRLMPLEMVQPDRSMAWLLGL